MDTCDNMDGSENIRFDEKARYKKNHMIQYL